MGYLMGVTLDIRSSNCGSTPFPHTAQLKDGTPNPHELSYSYQYSGGTDGDGDESVVSGTGEQSFLVTLIADRRYHLVDVAFASGDTQLSKHDQDTYKVTIKDANTANEEDYYQLLIKDTDNGDCSFWCDPVVTNEPPD